MQDDCKWKGFDLLSEHSGLYKWVTVLEIDQINIWDVFVSSQAEVETLVVTLRKKRRFILIVLAPDGVFITATLSAPPLWSRPVIESQSSEARRLFLAWNSWDLLFY